MTYRSVLMILAFGLWGGAQGAELPSTSLGQTFSTVVDEAGAISLPQDVRRSWVHLGSWTLEGGMHDVYTQPEALASYLLTGTFPDGTVLVKEVRHINSGVKTTGKVRWSGEIQQWFVMVKDERGRFKSNPLWGDGWGWGLFKPDQPSRQLATSYQADCRGCHIPAARTDRVFIEGYPILSKSAAKAATPQK